jgi:hypothetical protein
MRSRIYLSLSPPPLSHSSNFRNLETLLAPSLSLFLNPEYHCA